MQNIVASTGNGNFTTPKSQDYLPNDVGYGGVFPPQIESSISPYSDSRFLMKHQDMINRHALCLTRLREAAREVEALHLENASLRSVNQELSNQLSFLLKASLQKQCLSSDYDMTPFEIINRFNNFSIGGGRGDELCEEESPTSVMDVSSVDTERNWLPKSISVRSNGYLKMSQASASKTRSIARPTRPRTASSLTDAQKVYVRGGKNKDVEDPVELEVYNQGMCKTELCNKWQETGACPYGEHCQFAHGIEELRPVIRHPRYKTEVCRMVLAGDTCPYGHRCHFRHALTEEEKLIGNLRSGVTNMDR